FKGLNHLKLWVVQLTYHPESGAADKKNLSHILWRAKLKMNIRGFHILFRHTIKISILERCANCEIGNSVTVDVTKNRDRKSKVCRGRFRFRIEQCRPPSR